MITVLNNLNKEIMFSLLEKATSLLSKFAFKNEIISIFIEKETEMRERFFENFLFLRALAAP